MFEIGDEVQWTSQAQGRAKTKHGKVVEVVNTGGRPSLKFVDLHKQGCGYGRDHKSYVVRVAQGKTGSAKPKHYWPKASLLQPV